MNMPSGIRGALSILVLAGCSDGERQATPSFSVADSGGIQIVTNHAPAWTDSTPWRISQSPTLRLGEIDGPPELSFGNVRAVGYLPDGRIYVGDEQAHAIRIFSAGGALLETVGREGEGPGELQWFLTVSPYRQDSLFVYDYLQRTVSIFGPDLAFARRFRNPVLAGNYWISSALSDGRFVVYSPGSSRPPGGPGIVPDSSLIIVTAPDGAQADTVGAFEVTMKRLASNGRPQALYLQPYATITTAGNRVLWTRGETFEYVEADADGTVRRIVRKVHEPVPVTENIVSNFKTHYLDFLSREGPEGGEAGLDRVRQSLEEGEYYPTLPATSPDVEVDPLGNRWIGRYRFEGAVTEEWEVFDSTGVWLGSINTPPGLDVHQIAVDHVIGVARDEFNVPYVQVHQLNRSSGDDG